MEKRLGMIGGKPSRVRPIILRQNRIEKRYYSVDEDGSIKYSNAEMMALAIKQMFDDKFTAKDIELLTCGTSSADQILPSHTAMVHGCWKELFLSRLCLHLESVVLEHMLYNTLIYPLLPAQQATLYVELQS